MEAKQREIAQTPANQYVNSQLPFPKLLQESSMNDYGIVDNHLFKIGTEVSIIEEQYRIKLDIAKQIETKVSTMMTPDGKRLMTEGELLTAFRICDVTMWQSKLIIEKELQDIIKFVGIQTPMQGKMMLTPEEHDDIAMKTVRKLEKFGVKLFDSNKPMLIHRIVN
jgi:hypothetical protein